MDNLDLNEDVSTTHVPLSDTDVRTRTERDDVNFDRDHDRDRSRDRDDRDRGRRKERPSIRDTIRQSLDDVRQDGERSPRDDVDRDRGADEPQETVDQDLDKQPKAKIADAPTAWRKEAKAKWNELPDDIRAEVLKRETDIQKGVESLKKQYTDIDDAIAPYNQVIKQFQKTPAQAVSQLFSWFDALAKDPDRAFPALLQSYRYEPARLLQAYGVNPQELAEYIQWKNSYTAQQQQQAYQNGQGQYQNGQVPPNGQAQPEEIHPAVRQYIDGLHRELSDLKYQVGHHFDGLAQTFAQQNQAKTQEMLDRWAGDKPHFDQVRVLMGHLLTPDPQTGKAAVPLKENGTVDLDTAYAQACWMVPEIRDQMLTAQQQQQEASRRARQEAEYKAQQEKANQARRASGGTLRTSSPGTQVGRQVAPQKGLSVRQSLQQAIADLSNT